MATLASYFESQFHFDRRDLREVEDAIEQCAQLFAMADSIVDGQVLFDSQKGWRYEITKEKRIKSWDRVSISTTAMIAAAIQRLLGESKRIRAAEGYIEAPSFRGIKLSAIDKFKLEGALTSSKKILRQIVCKPNPPKSSLQHLKDTLVVDQEASEAKFPYAENIVVYSSTYGANDPASLGWCWDLLSAENDADINMRFSMALTGIKDGIKDSDYRAIIQPPKGRVGDSSFLILRLARLLLVRGELDWLPGLAGYFETQLHR